MLSSPHRAKAVLMNNQLGTRPFGDLTTSGQTFRVAMVCSSKVLANASAQETSVILYSYLAAGQEIRDSCNCFCAATRARTNCQDQISQRKPIARFDDLAKLAISFHKLAISGLSRSNAMSRC